MVRRWSCVNNINFNLISFSSIYFLKKRYKFINFKSSVSLKRFNKKYTKFKRKAFNRMKHRTNWSIYHNVINAWAKNYYFFKKTNKNQFLDFMFNYNYLFYNFISLRNDPIGSNFLPFTFFNQIKPQNKYLFFFSTFNIFSRKKYFFLEKNLNKFFIQSSLQTEQDLSSTDFSNYFLLKNHNSTFIQPSESREIVLDKKDYSNRERLIFFKLKFILENYKILQILLINNALI